MYRWLDEYKPDGKNAFGTLKTELVYYEKYRTRNQAQSFIFDYVESFYNKIKTSGKKG